MSRGGRGSTNSDLHCPDSISTFGGVVWPVVFDGGQGTVDRLGT